MIFLLLLLKLYVGHFLCDFPLQGDFLANAKNPWKPLPGVPWEIAMTAHCAIQGGMVAYVTGVWWLGLLEFVAHLVIDLLKCRGVISFRWDQTLHIWSKVVWVMIMPR